MTCDLQQTPTRRALVLLLVALLGCRCGGLSDEVDGQTFTRCTQVDPPSARTFESGALTFTLTERTLELRGARELRIAAFTGPVGAALEQDDLARLAAAQPALVLYMGGLGDSEAIAGQNLARVAALRVPTLFIAGGADRLPVIEAAFAKLPPEVHERVLHASGLRELRIGRDRFVIVAGAPLGRYAVDEHACGFAARDLATMQEELGTSPLGSGATPRVWLLSWHAPAGKGVAEGYDGSELGSPDLEALARALGAHGGLFAYPEVHAGEPRANPLTLVVPRLGRAGSQRADGSRIGSGVATLLLSEAGLVGAP